MAMSNDIGSHDPRGTYPPPIPPWAQPAPQSGVLVAHVYRSGASTIYLDHTGACDALELNANVSAGGDWYEAEVIYEDTPPMPPKGDGLWELRYPWRDVMEADFMDGDEPTGLDRNICCLYVGPPQWTLLIASLTTHD